MKPKMSVEQLLRWRLEHAKSEAPFAPRAARLLDLARPWWERSPEKFQSLVALLDRIEMVNNRTMAKSDRSDDRQRVAALVVRGRDEHENSARVQHFRIQDGRMNMRFKLEIALCPMEPAFEVTFVSDTPVDALFCALATVSADGTYQIDEVLPTKMALDWEQLKAMDRVPFRLILRS